MKKLIFTLLSTTILFPYLHAMELNEFSLIEKPKQPSSEINAEIALLSTTPYKNDWTALGDTLTKFKAHSVKLDHFDTIYSLHRTHYSKQNNKCLLITTPFEFGCGLCKELVTFKTMQAMHHHLRTHYKNPSKIAKIYKFQQEASRINTALYQQKNYVLENNANI